MGSNRFLKLALMALLALAPMQAGAALAAPKAVNPVDTEREASVLLSDTVTWMEPTTRLMAEDSDLLVEIVDLVSEAMEPSSREAAAGLADRLAAVDQRLAALKAAAAALPPFPANLEARYRTLGPEANPQIEGFKAMPGLARGLLDQTEAYLEDVRPHLLKAAAGDEDSQMVLAQKSVLAMAVVLKSENAFIDVSMGMMSPADHPQLALAKSIKTSNEAWIIAVEFLGEMLGGSDEADPVAAGKAMKARIGAARAQARLIEPRAKRMSSRLSASLSDGPLKTSLVSAMASFGESAEVELAILDQMDKLAEQLTEGVVDPDSEIWTFPGMEELVNRRLALQQQRAAVFQQK